MKHHQMKEQDKEKETYLGGRGRSAAASRTCRRKDGGGNGHAGVFCQSVYLYQIRLKYCNPVLQRTIRELTEDKAEKHFQIIAGLKNGAGWKKQTKHEIGSTNLIDK